MTIWPRMEAYSPRSGARGFLTRLDHPAVGTQTHAGIPCLLANAKNGVRSPAPILSDDTHSALGDILGYTREEIAKLEEANGLY